MTPEQMTERFATKKDHKLVVEAFQNAVARVDAMSDKISAIQDSIVALKESHDRHQAALTDSQAVTKLQIDDIKSVLSPHEKRTSLLEESKERTVQDLKKVVADHNQLQSQVSGLVTSLATIRNDLESLKKETDKIDSLKVEMKSGIDTLGLNHANLGTKVDRLDKSLSSLADRVQNSESQCGILTTQIKESTSQSNSVSIQLNNWVSALEAKLNSRLVSIEASVKSSTENKVALDVYVKNEDLTASIAKLSSTLESISLDAKNAYLKACNSSTQIDLINKKLESVQLLVKKYELNH